MLPRWVYTFIAVAVTVVWVMSHFVATLEGRDDVDQQLNYMMGAVVGATFGVRAISDYRRKQSGPPDG